MPLPHACPGPRTAGLSCPRSRVLVVPLETHPGAGSRCAPSRGSPQSCFLPRLSSPWSAPRAPLLPVAEGGLFTSRHWTRSLSQVPSDGALSAFPPSPGTPLSRCLPELSLLFGGPQGLPRWRDLLWGHGLQCVPQQLPSFILKDDFLKTGGCLSCVCSCVCGCGLEQPGGYLRAPGLWWEALQARQTLLLVVSFDPNPGPHPAPPGRACRGWQSPSPPPAGVSWTPAALGAAFGRRPPPALMTGFWWFPSVKVFLTWTIFKAQVDSVPG